MYENAIPDRTLQEIAEHRYSRGGTTTSIENGFIAEEDGAAMGGLHAYPMDLEANEPSDLLVNTQCPEVYEPFEHLHAEGSYYINVVAVYPEYRGRGVARRLIEEAEIEAKTKKLGLMSLHVFAENVNAVRLYENLGYREAARRPVVDHPRLRYGGDLIVMTRSLLPPM